MAILNVSNAKNLYSESIDNQMHRPANISNDSPLLSFEQTKRSNNSSVPDVQKPDGEKEQKKSWFSKNAPWIALGAVGIITAFAVCKNVQMSKQLADVSTQLAHTTKELNMTKAALSEAEGVIRHVQELATTPAKMSLKETLASAIKSATNGLKLTNELGSECGRLCENVANIKRLIG